MPAKIVAGDDTGHERGIEFLLTVHFFTRVVGLKSDFLSPFSLKKVIVEEDKVTTGL